MNPPLTLKLSRAITVAVRFSAHAGPLSDDQVYMVQHLDTATVEWSNVLHELAQTVVYTDPPGPHPRNWTETYEEEEVAGGAGAVGEGRVEASGDLERLAVGNG